MARPAGGVLIDSKKLSMNAFEVLDYEHQVMSPALTRARSIAVCMARPSPDTEQVAAKLIVFFQVFISQRHERKEHALFLYLMRKGLSFVVAPIAGFNEEHFRLHELTDALAAAWRVGLHNGGGSRARVAQYLADYAALMQAHILKEDRFYRVTKSILDAADLLDLKTAFEKIDQGTSGAEGYELCHRWI